MQLSHRVAIAVLTLVVSINAGAHAILIGSTPKVNGSVPAGHLAVALKYNSKIDQHRSRLVLIAADKSETLLAIIVNAGKANELESIADLKPGAYTIRWQALALDGHITRGDLPFTVTATP